MIRVADYIMQRLVQEDVKHLFYVPGGQCVYLMDALRRNEELKGIGTHHEQAAAMAVQETGKRRTTAEKTPHAGRKMIQIQRRI